MNSRADASVEADGFIGVYSSATATAAAGKVVERRSDQRSIPDMSRETITGSGDGGDGGGRSDLLRMAGGIAIVVGAAVLLGVGAVAIRWRTGLKSQHGTPAQRAAGKGAAIIIEVQAKSLTSVHPEPLEVAEYEGIGRGSQDSGKSSADSGKV